MTNSPSQLYLHLLGGFRLLDGEGREVRITGKKSQALLAYLALTPGREHGREALATLLWGDRQDDQARQSLRQALSELRKAFEGNGDALHTEGEAVSINGGGLTVDALAFADLAGNGGGEALEDAVALYAGPLLDGSRVDAEGFNAWLASERERLHGLACGALYRVASDKEQAGDSTDAMDATKRLLVLDPLHEEAHRLLMGLHAAAGRRTDALRQYQTCADALRRELDAEPSEATTRLYEEIRNGEGANGAAASRPSQSPKVEATATRPRRPKWLMGLAAVVVIAALGVGGWFYADGLFEEPSAKQQVADLLGGLEIPDKISIAVLPFLNLSGDPKQEYFSDGLSESITTRLARLSQMFVIARGSAFQYKGKQFDVKQVGRELGVRYVLEGSVQRTATRIRINAHLIDTITGNHLWAQAYERELKNIFAVQDDITRHIVTELKVNLTEGELARFYDRETNNVEALDHHLRGWRLFMNFDEDSNNHSRDLFSKAIELDPNYALALAWLGWTHYIDVLYRYSDNPADSLRKAEALATKALKIKPLAAANTLLSRVYASRRQYDLALKHNREGVKLQPNDTTSLAVLSHLLVWMGRYEEALPPIEHALRLHPYPEIFMLNFAGEAYYFSGQFEKANLYYRKFLKRQKKGTMAGLSWQFLIAGLMEIGLKEEAAKEMENMLKYHPNYSVEKAEATVRGLLFKDFAFLGRHLELLRGAGLPE